MILLVLGLLLLVAGAEGLVKGASRLAPAAGISPLIIGLTVVAYGTSMPEMVVIAVIALIIFGHRKLPELGKSLGKSIAEFNRASNELKNTLERLVQTLGHGVIVVATAPRGLSVTVHDVVVPTEALEGGAARVPKRDPLPPPQDVGALIERRLDGIPGGFRGNAARRGGKLARQR